MQPQKNQTILKKYQELAVANYKEPRSDGLIMMTAPIKHVLQEIAKDELEGECLNKIESHVNLMF